MSLADWTKDAQALIREWQSDAKEQERVARRLGGAERSAAIAHGNTKSACANMLQRLMWQHGLMTVAKGEALSDDVDRAQTREQLDRALALQALAERVAASYAPRRGDIDGVCIDCDGPIEPARLAALDHKTSRCASCAADHEHRLKGCRR